jgi:hypothetical protein
LAGHMRRRFLDRSGAKGQQPDAVGEAL